MRNLDKIKNEICNYAYISIQDVKRLAVLLELVLFNRKWLFSYVYQGEHWFGMIFGSFQWKSRKDIAILQQIIEQMTRSMTEQCQEWTRIDEFSSEKQGFLYKIG